MFGHDLGITFNSSVWPIVKQMGSFSSIQFLQFHLTLILAHNKVSSILSRLYRRIYTLAIWIGFIYSSYQDTLTFNHNKAWSQKKLGERFKTLACHTHKSITPHLLLSGCDSIASIMRLRWNSKIVVNKSLHPKCFIFRMQWSWQQKDLLAVNLWQVLSHF